jgi:hypothetical protein
LAELLELDPLDASCGQLSLDALLLPFELPLPLEVLELPTATPSARAPA